MAKIDGLNKGRWARFKENASNRYRLVILSEDNFQEIGNYQLTLGNIYALISSIIVVLGLLIISVIAFTPIKKLIPGYGDIEDNTMFIELNKQLDYIESNLDAQEVYLKSFRKLLMADSSGVSPKENDDNSKLRLAINLAEKDNEDIKASSPTPGNSNKGGMPILDNTYNFITPVSGLVSAEFMPDKKHFGVDILAPKNTPVKAILDGFVLISGWNLETGNTIGIQHNNNVISFYKHNSALLKEEGSFVRAGEAIAIIGNTGTLSDGPHLHFELWLNGNPVNPMDYLNF